jgi:hypothetical protein
MGIDRMGATFSATLTCANRLGLSSVPLVTVIYNG